MHNLEIKLKQHTPLIHFQHDQHGATLRASEVKPKLDKFILTRLGNGNYSSGLNQAKTNGWLVGKGEHPALDYKVRIEAPSKEVWTIPNKGEFPFFGNMDSGGNVEFKRKEMVFCLEPISVSFFSLHIELIKEIDKQVNSFFLLHNFGTRQSKGFGSFLREGNEKSAEQLLEKGYAKFSWIPSSKFGTREAFESLFMAVNLYYKTLRSGINQNEVYLKSLVYFYAKDGCSSYWDKRAIRHHFEHFKPDEATDKGEVADQKNDKDNNANKARLFRDMLGLSSTQLWKYYGDTINKTDPRVSSDDNKVKEKAITRFKSPLLIKPIDVNGKFTVLLIPLPINDKYKGVEFEITSQTKRNKGALFLKTPDEFNVRDFLQFVTRQNIKRDVLQGLSDQKNKLSDTLKLIYNNIEYVG